MITPLEGLVWGLRVGGSYARRAVWDWLEVWGMLSGLVGRETPRVTANAGSCLTAGSFW